MTKGGSNSRDKPTTPTFLSDVDAAPATNPVVYSPVPTIKTAGGAMMSDQLAKFDIILRTLRGLRGGAIKRCNSDRLREYPVFLSNSRLEHHLR